MLTVGMLKKALKGADDHLIVAHAAAAVWACHGDWRKATYWIATAVLTTVVTY